MKGKVKKASKGKKETKQANCENSTTSENDQASKQRKRKNAIIQEIKIANCKHACN